MLQPQAIGSYFDRSRWPLHITLMPWFEAGVPLEVLRHELDTASQRIAPLDVTVGEDALFGADKNILVSVIANQTDVQRMHRLLLTVLRQLGLRVVDEQWTGEAYTAHITHQSDSVHAQNGDVVHIDSLHLVRLVDEHTCEIVAECNLTGSLNG